MIKIGFLKNHLRQKKTFALTLVVVWFLGIFYLLLPPAPIPNLPDSLRSTEPGDSGGIPTILKAYYTDLSRKEVVDYYDKGISKSSFGKIPFLSYRLNHPPEYVKETIIDVIHSNFYEEIVHPLRESLFISGWILKEDENYLKKTENPLTYFIIDGGHYEGKIILHYVSSPVWIRILVWSGILGLILIQFHATIIIIRPLWPKKK